MPEVEMLERYHDHIETFWTDTEEVVMINELVDDQQEPDDTETDLDADASVDPE
jgi:hypothetical protein